MADPFNPLEAPVIRGDKTERRAVAVAQGLTGNVRRQETDVNKGQRKAATVTGGGFDGEALGFRPGAGQGQQPIQGDSTPLLLGKKAAGAVQCGGTRFIS